MCVCLSLSLSVSAPPGVPLVQVWMGDTNYHVAGLNADEATAMIENNELSTLLEHDELIQEKLDNQVGAAASCRCCGICSRVSSFRPLPSHRCFIATLSPTWPPTSFLRTKRKLTAGLWTPRRQVGRAKCTMYPSATPSTRVSTG